MDMVKVEQDPDILFHATPSLSEDNSTDRHSNGHFQPSPMTLSKSEMKVRYITSYDTFYSM
jgi:hypothetical protein